jgi:hypothetical protein
MENNQKITYGLIGLLSLIVATMSGTIFLTEDQLNNAYICSVNQEVVIADHLSSTAKTAYWLDENSVEQSKVCRNGFWLNLKQYAKDNDLDINILLQNLDMKENSATIAEAGKSYICDQTECREKS